MHMKILQKAHEYEKTKTDSKVLILPRQIQQVQPSRRWLPPAKYIFKFFLFIYFINVLKSSFPNLIHLINSPCNL